MADSTEGISYSPLWASLTPERKEELLRWWGVSLYATGDDSFWPIENYAIMTLGDIRCVEDALAEVFKKLPKCKAIRPAQFRKWCRAQIDKEAARLRTNEKTKHKNTKPFHCYERDGAYFIPVLDAKGTEHIWKVPPDWIDDVQERIWPVHIKWHANGKPYLARKKSLKWPGELEQKTLPAHHTYLWFKYPGISEGDIACSRARNGDFLDWTNDNIYVPAFDGLSVSEAAREIRIKKATEQSSYKEVKNGRSWERVPVGIDPELIEEWERKLDQDKGGPRDITEVGIKACQPEIAESQAPIKAFDPRRMWRTPSTA